MEEPASIDISLSINPKAASPKSVHVSKTSVLCNLVFVNGVRRLVNSTTLYAVLVSLIPPHLLALMEGFSDGVDRTLKSLVILYASWLRGMKPIVLGKSLHSQGALMKIVQLAALSRFALLKATVHHLFSLDIKSEPRTFVEFTCRDKEAVYLDVGSFEVKNSIPPLPKLTARAVFVIGDEVSLVLNLASASKSFAQYVASLSMSMSVVLVDRRAKPQMSPVDLQAIPEDAKSLKNHPVYILESHLKKYEVIYPQEVAGFLDNEAVYFRRNVCKVKSKEAWLTQHGMSVKELEQPAKVVLLSSKTNKLQSLYGPWQVQKYERPACDNGRIPVNNFGNVDLFVPDMVPIECVHINLPDAKKIAKALGIDHADACTGFSFRKGKAAPDINGIVIHEADRERFDAEYSKAIQVIRQKELHEFEAKLVKLWQNACDAIVNGRRIKMSSKSSLCTVRPRRSREDTQVGTSIFDISAAETTEAFETL